MRGFSTGQLGGRIHPKGRVPGDSGERASVNRRSGIRPARRTGSRKKTVASARTHAAQPKGVGGHKSRRFKGYRSVGVGFLTPRKAGSPIGCPDGFSTFAVSKRSGGRTATAVAVSSLNAWFLQTACSSPYTGGSPPISKRAPFALGCPTPRPIPRAPALPPQPPASSRAASRATGGPCALAGS